MTLNAGTRLGPYEVVSPLGAGGMGEVYRARDTRLGRTVAIKVLSSEIASDSLRLRFEREARVISALGHPNICTLHDVGNENGVDYLVMEYLEGETLDERLRKGPMPVDEVLARGIEIADALEKAHRSGVVHRDLKPGNVMLTRSGAKLLDFGLAKPSDAEAIVVGPSQATEQKPITTEGTIVGTFQYMAPEQIEGRTVDARTDIFAFGAMLYEMLTARRAFEGKSRASMIAAILATEPPAVSSLRPLTPPSLDRVVRICLAKDPDERWQTAHDLKLELEGVRETKASAQPEKARGGSRAGWIAAALVLAAATTAGVLDWRRNHAADTSFEYEIAPPEGSHFDPTNSPAIVSPDGRRICVRIVDNKSLAMLYIRDVGSREMRPLDGTRGAWDAFWSPDSRSIGFFTDEKLKHVDVNGGPVTVVCDAADGRGGTWAPDGTILFANSANGPIERVRVSGGKPVPVTHLDKSRGEFGHWRPQMLPDGRHFLFIALSANAESSGIYAGSLDGPEVKRVLDSQGVTIYAPPGYLVYVHDGDLFAQKFNASKLKIEGVPFAIAKGVAFSNQYQAPAFSASQDGLLAYHLSGRTTASTIGIFDASGKLQSTLTLSGNNLDLSRDGSRLAVQRVVGGGDPDIWVYDLARGVSSRITFKATPDFGPVWSPDGKRLAYVSQRPEEVSVMTCASGGSNEELLLASPEEVEVVDWSRDGRYLLVEHQRVPTKRDLDVIDLSKNPATLQPVIASPFTDTSARFSPDGKWIAYVSDVTGQNEIYVEPFPPDGSKSQISESGGDAPRWRGDSREVVFVKRDLSTMGVGLEPSPTGLRVSTPKLVGRVSSNDYVMDAAGKVFIASETAPQTPQPIVVTRPWYRRSKQ